MKFNQIKPGAERTRRVWTAVVTALLAPAGCGPFAPAGAGAEALLSQLSIVDLLGEDRIASGAGSIDLFREDLTRTVAGALLAHPEAQGLLEQAGFDPADATSLLDDLIADDSENTGFRGRLLGPLIDALASRIPVGL